MTATTLRPNGTIAAGGTVTGAASAHAALSDDSDASYVGAYTGNGEYDSGTFTLPTGAVMKQARIRVRSKDTGVSWVQTSWRVSAGDSITNHYTNLTSSFWVERASSNLISLIYHGSPQSMPIPGCFPGCAGQLR